MGWHYFFFFPAFVVLVQRGMLAYRHTKTILAPVFLSRKEWRTLPLMENLTS